MPGDAVEQEVDTFHESVLGEDEPTGKLGGVVLGAHDQPACLQLTQETELAGVRELHRQPPGELRPRPRRE